MKLDLDGLSKEQLLRKLQQFKVSDASPEIKEEAISQVEAKLGIFEKRTDILQSIDEGSADIDDIE